MVLDLIFVLILAVCIIMGIKQGFVRSLLGIASLFVSIIAAVYLYKPFIDMLYGIPAVSGVIDSIIVGIKNAILSALSSGETQNIPPFLGVFMGNMVATSNEMIAGALAEAAFSCILVIVFIILVRIAIAVLVKALNLFTKLPVIKQFNGLLGGIMGLVTGILICYIAATILFVWANTGNVAWINESLTGSAVAKHFFETNILISSVFKH